VTWDEENDNYDELILQGLLQVDDWFFDVECIHEKGWEWFEVNVAEIEEITY
jgi:hypothetical protein